MALQIGHDFTFYYNTGTNASPTWVLVDEVGEVNLSDLGVNSADVNLRSTDWILALPAKLKAPTIEFFLANNPGSTAFDTLRGYALARTTAQYAIADGAIATNGTQGFKLFCHIENFPWNQPPEELSGGQVSLKGSYVIESSALVEPAWFTISA